LHSKASAVRSFCRRDRRPLISRAAVDRLIGRRAGGSASRQKTSSHALAGWRRKRPCSRREPPPPSPTSTVNGYLLAQSSSTSCLSPRCMPARTLLAQLARTRPIQSFAQPAAAAAAAARRSVHLSTPTMSAGSFAKSASLAAAGAEKLDVWSIFTCVTLLSTLGA
jgi:hypothetical protein